MELILLTMMLEGLAAAAVSRAAAVRATAALQRARGCLGLAPGSPGSIGHGSGHL
jgi:hypothetical protein